MGPGVKTGVGKKNAYTLLYNEYIVYTPAQARMRYLLRIQFNYNSLWWKQRDGVTSGNPALLKVTGHIHASRADGSS